MTQQGASDWDRALTRMALAAPNSPYLVLRDDGSWRIFRWAETGASKTLELQIAGLTLSVQVPERLAIPGHAAKTLTELADAVGVSLQDAVLTSSRSSFPSPPRGIDGARQNPGVRPAPVLDAQAGVISCTSCAARGVVQLPCPCGPAGHLLALACSLCGGSRVVNHVCDACSGVGSFLWPATLRIARFDASSGPSGDREIAVDVDLAACDVSIERSLLDSGNGVVWEDRWVVDLFRPFQEGCRELGVEWPQAVVWVQEQPTIASRVSTAFTLLRMGTPTTHELALQPNLEPWLVREGPVSPAEVLDPEYLGLHAAAIVARISRGVVFVSPLPELDDIVAECEALLAPAHLRLALLVGGPVKVAIAFNVTGEVVGILGHGASVAEVLLHVRHNLART